MVVIMGAREAQDGQIGESLQVHGGFVPRGEFEILDTAWGDDKHDEREQSFLAQSKRFPGSLFLLHGRNSKSYRRGFIAFGYDNYREIVQLPRSDAMRVWKAVKRCCWDTHGKRQKDRTSQPLWCLVRGILRRYEYAADPIQCALVRDYLPQNIRNASEHEVEVGIAMAERDGILTPWLTTRRPVIALRELVPIADFDLGIALVPSLRKDETKRHEIIDVREYDIGSPADTLRDALETAGLNGYLRLVDDAESCIDLHVQSWELDEERESAYVGCIGSEGNLSPQLSRELRGSKWGLLTGGTLVREIPRELALLAEKQALGRLHQPLTNREYWNRFEDREREAALEL
jgi:hypothetical protein